MKRCWATLILYRGILSKENVNILNMDSINNSEDFTNPKKRKPGKPKLQRQDSLSMVKKERRRSIRVQGFKRKGSLQTSEEPHSRTPIFPIHVSSIHPCSLHPKGSLTLREEEASTAEDIRCTGTWEKDLVGGRSHGRQVSEDEKAEEVGLLEGVKKRVAHKNS